jgi:hypothetical protein
MFGANRIHQCVRPRKYQRHLPMIAFNQIESRELAVPHTQRLVDDCQAAAWFVAVYAHGRLPRGFWLLPSWQKDAASSGV